jgi:transposase
VNKKEKSDLDKTTALNDSGTLNPLPESVKDTLFQTNEFFDPRDIVQVKYELLRKVQSDGILISEAAKNFGFSRLSYYRISALFKELGLYGLLPKKRGPKHGHKLHPKLLEFTRTLIQEDPSRSNSEIKTAIANTFNISISTRTIGRSRKKKETRE